MNIFVLDSDQKIAAQAHCDKHCVKMVLETAQLLSTAVRLSGIDYGYKSTHVNHPCSIWARQSLANFTWLKELGIYLGEEYSFRFGRRHKSSAVIKNIPNIPGGNTLTDFAQAMPDKFKNTNNAIAAYRDYYINSKRHLLVYTNRCPPEWAYGFAIHRLR